jgi:adenylylsulfate kinase-like enzyme
MCATIRGAQPKASAPRKINVRGISGAGKSTVADALLARLEQTCATA